MSKVSLGDIALDANKNFRNLFTKSWQQVTKYSKLYSDNDARCDFFIIFTELNMWLLIQLDNFYEIQKLTNNHISKYMNLNSNDRTQFVLEYDTINKSSYLLLAMFEVEVFLKDIARSMGFSDKGNFSEFSKNFLQKISYWDQYRFDVLNTPAQIRNSLHNGGYPTKNFQSTIRNRNYKLVSGKAIDVFSWEDIYTLLDELIDVLVDIIDNTQVANAIAISHKSTYLNHS